MRKASLLVSFMILAGCGTYDGASGTRRSSRAAPTEPLQGLETATSAQSFKKWSWDVAVNVGDPVNTEFVDQQATISQDDLSMFFVSDRPGGQGSFDLWTTSRACIECAWQTPVNLPFNTSGLDFAPSLSPDNMALFFSSNRPGGFGSNDLYVVRRTDGSDNLTWSAPENLGPLVNTAAAENASRLGSKKEAGTLGLYFNRGATALNISDIYRADATDAGIPLNNAVPVPELNSPVNDANIAFTRDMREAIFWSARTGALGPNDLYMSRRSDRDGPWGAPVNLGVPPNSDGQDITPCYSEDDRVLYFTSNRAGGLGGLDIFRVERTKD
jgi:hypothetical protein